LADAEFWAQTGRRVIAQRRRAKAAQRALRGENGIGKMLTAAGLAELAELAGLAELARFQVRPVPESVCPGFRFPALFAKSAKRMGHGAGQ
jgi:hypothetical protein